MPRVPLRWLAEYVDVPQGTDAEEIAEQLASVGLEEEEIHGADISGPLVVGRVLEATPEEQKNGKTINWCSVDVGEDAPRGIVCGAHNFGPGDLVVVALPGSVLPGPFPISARKTYGHVSDGMICSARELELGDDHAGIIVLTELGFDADALAPGQDAIELLGLAEKTLEINVTPDRGYCFSVRGVAREYAHATGRRVADVFHDPAKRDVPAATTDGFPVEIVDDAPVRGVIGCDRFVARIVRGIDATAPSPAWMKRRLTQSGMRPISLAVDVTNYVMLALGQPLHAYDLGLVSGPITVRRARPGEKITTLDDVVRDLNPEDLLITDAGNGEPGSRALGMAGVMGGEDTEVSAETTDVLIEAAHFDQVSTARTSRRHRLSSEASRRFERGVDPAVAAAAADWAVALLVEHGGGVADTEVTDVSSISAAPVIALPVGFPGRIIGVDYTPEQVTDTLGEIGCTWTDDVGVLAVTPPSWRPDLREPIDLVEEVARLRGYAEIPSLLPSAPGGRGLNRSQRAERVVAQALADRGMVEVLSYPFVSADRHDDMRLAADDPRRLTVRLANPMSDEQPLLRTMVLDTLVDVARRNVGRGFSDVALFEVGLVFRPDGPVGTAPRPAVAARPSDDELAAIDAAVPRQPRRVAGVFIGHAEPSGWWGSGRLADHTDAIAAARSVAAVLGLDLEVAQDLHEPWHPGRCARLTIDNGRTLVGHAGELHPKVLETLGLPARAAAFEMDLDVLVAALGEPAPAEPISTFPLALDDIALVIDDSIPAARVATAVREGIAEAGLADLVEDVALFDVYTGDQIDAGRRSLAFSLRMRAADRTLTADDTAAVRAAAVRGAEAIGAALRT